MAILKCKMCGGDLNLIEGASVAECEFCGSMQTVPRADDEKKLNLFARANRLRVSCDFDKAAGVYEAVIADFPDEAEAYWGLVLCKYGIEYVDDPGTGKKIPTCHRSSYESVLEDSDLEQALENADPAAQEVYRTEAKQFERIRKGILEVSSQEKPYDIFICYKETDEKGDRTLDSVLAQDLYASLTDKGYRVFFSRITLQGKLGEAYEPYIFAALNSAKVMLAVGTRYSYYNAVWVRNEWSRYLKICAKDKSKHLIPCYKDIDPEDMPKEFNHLQGADLGKMGAVQDILFNMEKYIPLNRETPAVRTLVTKKEDKTDPLLQRAFMFLEDKKWDSADEYCEKVLDLEPQNPRAYLGKLMATLKVQKQELLKEQPLPFDKQDSYQKAIRFGDLTLQEALKGDIAYIKNRNLENAYQNACRLMEKATEDGCRQASAKFAEIPNYKDAAQLAKDCLKKAEMLHKEGIYKRAYSLMDKNTVESCRQAAGEFRKIPGYKDSDQLVSDCLERAEKIRQNIIFEGIYKDACVLLASDTIVNCKKAAAEFEKISNYKDAAQLAEKCIQKINVLEKEEIYKVACYRMSRKSEDRYREAAEEFRKIPGYKDADRLAVECIEKAEAIRKDSQQYQKKRKVKILLVTAASCTVIGFLILLFTVIIPSSHYKEGLSLLAAGKELEALAAFDAANGYKDAAEKANPLRIKFTQHYAISSGDNHTVGLKADGTVVAVGDNSYEQCDVGGWTNIISVSAGSNYTVGLEANGTVKYAGNYYGLSHPAATWTDIVAVSAGDDHIIGLKADGTVIASGYGARCDVDKWKGIIAVSAGYDHTVGLKADGTVVAVGNNRWEECEVDEWTDIVAVSAGYHCTVGLKSDGTVVAVGDNSEGQCNVADWSDIIAVSTGAFCTTGLKDDGTVVVTGGSDESERIDWTDVVAICAGKNGIAGLKSDGTMVAVGDNSEGQYNVADWTDIKIPE